MKKITIFIGVLLALLVAGYFYSAPIKVGAFTVFKSGQVGSSPSNGYILSTDGSESTWIANTGGSSFNFTPQTGGNGTSTTILFNQGLVSSGSTTISSLGTGIVTATNGLLSVGVNGTDYTLISALTCGAGQHLSAVTAAGAFTCSADTGSGGTGLATTTPTANDQVLVYNSAGAGFAYTIATTSLTVTGPFTIASPIGVLKNGAVVYTGLATTSQPASSNLLVSNGGAGVYGVATSTLTPSSPLTGSFTQIGSGGSLGIQDAAADGSTKGAATFYANDFSSVVGLITLDYANGDKASAINPGFLSSTDWSTFNNKISSTSLSATFPLTYNSTTGAFTSLFSTTTNSGMSAGSLYVGSGGVFQTAASSSIFGYTPEQPLTFSAPLIRTSNNVAWTGLATTSQPASSNLLVSNGGPGVYGVATTTVSCAGNASCTQFTTLGSSPITITVTGGGTGLSTSTPLSNGNVLVYSATDAGYAYGTATSSLTVSGPFVVPTGLNILGSNGAITYTGLATTSNLTQGQLLYNTTGGNGVASVGTTTLSGTANQLSISNSPVVIGSAGAVLSLPNHVIFPSSFQATSASTTNATSTNMDITGLLTFNGVTGSTWAAFCTSITGAAALCDGDDATGAGGGTYSFYPYSTYATTTSATTSPIFSAGGFFASTTSATPSLGITQSGTGPAATFMGGNVGIGSTSPWGLLSVNPNFNNNPSLVIGSSTATHFIFDYDGTFTMGTTSRFATNSCGVFCIDTGSGVPSTQSLSSVTLFGPNSFTASFGQNSKTGTELAIANSSTNGALSLRTKGTTRFAIDANGAIGIGSSSAATFDPLNGLNLNSNYQLTIQDLSVTTGSTTGIAFAVTSSYQDVGASILFKRTGSNDQGELQFYTKQSTSVKAAPVQALTINNQGFVSVGSTTPYARLSVQGNAFDPTTATTLFAIGSSTATATSTLFTVKNTGKTGIGTSTPYGLLSLDAPAGTDPYFVIGSSTEVAKITAAATPQFGLGTSTPFGSLSVEMGTETNTVWIGNQGSTSPAFSVQGINGNGVVGIASSTSATSTSIVLVVGNASVLGPVASFGNTTGLCLLNPTSGLGCPSDINLKKNINDLGSSLKTLMKLRPVVYNWKGEKDGSPTHAGFIAQEVELIYPDLVTETETGTKLLDYSRFIPYIVSALQDQQKQIDNIKDTETNNWQWRVIGFLVLMICFLVLWNLYLTFKLKRV